jgi:DNA ligase-1
MEWRQVTFNVFDTPDDPGNFNQRINTIRTQLDQANVPWLDAIRQFQVPDEAALKRQLSTVVQQGGEGLMLHHTDALWEAGRNSNILKLKPYDDAEATIIGYEPGQGRLAGQTGALIVRLENNGAILRLGSGLSDALRQHPPPIGSQVTYRYRGTTNSGLPRFATFWRRREDE